MGLSSKKSCVLLTAELRRRVGDRIVPNGKLQSFDPDLLSCAIEATGSIKGAASWLTCLQYGLRNRIPLSVAKNAKGKAAVIQLLGRIDRGVLA